MLDHDKGLAARRSIYLLAPSAWVVALLLTSTALAAPGQVTVRVVSPNSTGAEIPVGFRWVLEEDTTYPVTPGVPSPESLATNFHKSYMPVAGSGHFDAGQASKAITVPDSSKRYLISVLPDQPDPDACQAPGNCFTQSGKQIGAGQTSVTVVVPSQPVPTAQIFLRAFEDNAPINGVWDDGEEPLEGFTVFIYDMGGQLNTDTFGNPLGTVYEGLSSDGSPRIKRLGDGSLHTMTAAEAGDPAKNPYGLEVGEALVKNIAPGKYGVQVVPPYGLGWQQTSTIEGTKGFDAWVKAGEPKFFAEFGPAGHHAEIGFVRPDRFPNRNGGRTLSGHIANLHMSRPPNYTFYPGHPLPGCWVGLNDATGTQGIAVTRCADDSSFSIPNVAAGTYQLVVFDDYLDLIINTVSVTVPAGSGEFALPNDPIQTFRWYQSHEHWVFNDLNENGKRDPGEAGIPDQAINLRYRDGSIYQSSTTDTTGYLPFDEVFPFFSWLVAEVDFMRFKATGVTIAVDGGGAITDPEENGAVWPRQSVGHGHLTPQIQTFDGGGETRTECSNTDVPGCTAPGPVLLEGYNAFIGTTNTFEWGKKAYEPGENGGITGVVHYSTTRAENDPRFAAAETWEPGIPRVQLNLYRSDAIGAVLHADGSTPTSAAPVVLSDADSYPRCWNPDNAGGDDSYYVKDHCTAAGRGAEDLDRNDDGVFEAGDSLEIAYSDSWDDATPTGCPGDPGDPFYQNGKCYDGLRNFNQVRPAVFDGGYAFGKPFTDLVLTSGYYVVEAHTPVGYLQQREEDKNVDFGDAMTLSPQALPPLCVGDMHAVPAELSLFPGVESYLGGGASRPLCDRKLVLVSDAKNTAADFFMFTEVPVSGHINGFVLNDLSNEFDPTSPNFGEKAAPSYIPVSVRDFAGNEVYHTYTDQWGTYNAIVPSAFRINTPMPSGVSPSMLQVCLNAPLMENPAFNPAVAEGATNPRLIAEPNFNKQFSQFCYTLDFKPGQTTYLDTPVLPIAAFAGPGNKQLDCEYPGATPAIHSVTVQNSTVGGGPFVPTGGTVSQRTLTITSMGTVSVPDPNFARVDGNMAQLISRDYGFGTAQGTVTLNGVAIPAANITSWSNSTITVVVPAAATTSQLHVTRGDNLRRTERGVTVTVGDPSRVRVVQPGASIQAQIDNPLTKPGDIVLVAPGTYFEMLVITKPIQLQGWGAPATVINPVQSPTEKIAEWRKKVNYLANCSHQIGLLDGQPNNTASASAQCGFTPGTGLFATEEGPGVLIAPVAGAFNGTAARVDGFTITGADQSAGIVVSGNSSFLEISNNILANNQGLYAGGIRIGFPSLLGADDEVVDGNNDNINVHNNLVTQNGGLSETEPGAGIGIYTGADNYRVTNNYVCGNFGTGDGAGIAHYGLSRGGLIADNKLLFNQSFDQTTGGGGSGGGILVAGHEPQAAGAVGVSAGSGSVKILRNTIQGNNAGSGDGGGIALRFINGQDVIASGNANNWFTVDILNNSVTNNVAGRAAGGISLQDAVRVNIVNNTVANNDSTATIGTLFNAAQNQSTPQPAGIVARAHTAGFAAIRPGLGTFSNPLRLQNNIIVGNRSQYWSVDSNGVGHLNLASPAIRDLAVLDAAGVLTPTFSVLTDGAAPAGNNNQFIAGDIAGESAVFVAPYFNQPPTGLNLIQPDGTVISDAVTPVQAAAATDEGGNFIDVHYAPLSPVDGYHLIGSNGNANPARNRGATPGLPNQAPDIDGQARPRDACATGSGICFDIGADEIQLGGTGAGANQSPSISVPGTFQLLPAYRNAPFVLQVVAGDPNNDALTYSLSAGLIGNPAMPPGIQINSATGLVTWTPPATGPATSNCASVLGVMTCSFRVTVSDAQASTTRAFLIAIVNAGVPAIPGGVYDKVFAVNRSGPFTVAAPGVLAGFSPGGLGGATTAHLLTNATSGGSVGLEANGSFTFTPDTTFVGTTSFTYSATNNAGSSVPGTVTLSREFTVLDANYIAGSGAWAFRGVSSVPNRTLTFRRTRGNVLLNGTVTTDASGAWTFESPPGTAWQAGDTVSVTASGAGLANFELQQVAVSSLSAATAPLSTAYVQCPGDNNGDAVIDTPDPAHPRAVCKHLAAGDGFARMADGTELYTFGFNDLTGVPANLAIDKGILNAHFPAPTLAFDEGDEVYLTLTNVGMLKRPDLFDPHSVHFHGFPNAASVFDGVPESSIAINMGFSLTYYYRIVEPGTFMYHCHVEASEHMQMGMLGNLYVRPAQDGQSIGGRTTFVYNDTDGSTGYDVEVPIQIGSFDSNFHIQHIGVQPLPFAEMHDDYPMLNGRGYPDTVDTTALPPVAGGDKATSGVTSAEESSQVVHTHVEATAGQKVLLRISNLNVTRFYTLTTTGLTMKIVGTGAHILRGPGGLNLYYDTNSVTLGGGEAVDVLIDTTGVAPGTYLLYSSNLEALSNGNEDFGGMMTEIVIH